MSDDGGRRAGCRNDPGTSPSVSYTHLDVYKRQLFRAALENPVSAYVVGEKICEIVDSLSLIHISALRGASMIDHEKFQKGRMWAYAVGALVFIVVVAWKFAAR